MLDYLIIVRRAYNADGSHQDIEEVNLAMFDFETCPSCGRTPDGQTHHGAPKANGSMENICWKCAEMYTAAVRKFFQKLGGTEQLLELIRRVCKT